MAIDVDADKETVMVLSTRTDRSAQNLRSRPGVSENTLNLSIEGIRCQNDVVYTSMRRNDVASTLI